MFLPTQGANRDRTTDFHYMRVNDKESFSNENSDAESDGAMLISHHQPKKQSVLEPFFQLYRDIKYIFRSLDNLFDSLQKAQHKCFRPTFTDVSDQCTDVNLISTQISQKIKEISSKINYFDTSSNPETDRSIIIRNLKTSLLSQLNEFNTNFTTARQTFNATYFNFREQQESTDQLQTVDYSSFNFGENREILEQERQLQQNSVQIAELRRHAEQIKDMFLQLSTIIQSQGEIVNRIDFNITQTLDNSIAANDEITKAARYQKKSRMWFVVLFLFLFVLILILFIILQ